MTIQRFNMVHDFLRHKTQEKGGSFLKDWKEKGNLELFFHTKHIPTVVWAHQWPTLVPVEDKQTREVVNHVYGKQYNCLETELVLKAQHFRHDDGRRKKLPERCGFCKLLDWVYMQVASGRLPLEKPIFRVAGDVEKERTTIHAAGFVGQLKADKLSEGALKRLRDANVSIRDGFKENCLARASYVCVLVNVASPSDGAQIATIAASLGDKLQDVITDKMLEAKKAKGDEALGDPFQHPYQFEFLYDEKETNPNKKYRVRAFVDVKPSPAILETITGDEVSLDRVFEPMNQVSLRMRMERACLLTGKEAPPWDEFFPKVEEEAEADGSAEDTGTDFPPSEDAPAPEVGGGAPKEDVLYECEKCGKDSLNSPNLCLNCGAKYDDEGNLVPEPAPPPPPKTSRRSTKPKGADEAPAEGKKSFKPGF